MGHVKDPAVSVIIPARNARAQLKYSLPNILGQTLENIEIIFVDDGSTDGTALLLEVAERKFPEKVTVIESQVGHGAGGARNLGLDIARGRYVGFVDSDDLVSPMMFEKMYNAAREGDYDIVDCGYDCEEQDLALVHTTDEMCGELNDEKRSELIVSGGYLWSRIFRRELFDGLRFRENVILEDADVLTYLFCTAKSIVNVKEVLYAYRNVEDSASKIVDYRNYVENINEAMRAVYERVFNLGVYPGVKEAVEYSIVQMYSYGLSMCQKAVLDSWRAGREVPFDVSHLQEALRETAAATVEGRYCDNKYVKDKIAELDIFLMELNNENPAAVVEYIKNNSDGVKGIVR
ncbi:MAG: glycosyltransferase [Eubacterium sp.]|nr:glycosyltransferase [Eubacterium sp.]